MDKKKNKGFTLVELIVVLAILAVLAAMLVPALTGYIDKANEKKVLATARQYYVAAQTVYSDAYANGDEILIINYFDNENAGLSIYVGNYENSYTESSATGKYKGYIEDFKSLAEITDNTTSISATFRDKKLDTFGANIGGKQANFDGGNWTVTDVRLP